MMLNDCGFWFAPDIFRDIFHNFKWKKKFIFLYSFKYVGNYHHNNTDEDNDDYGGHQYYGIDQ